MVSWWLFVTYSDIYSRAGSQEGAIVREQGRRRRRRVLVVVMLLGVLLGVLQGVLRGIDDLKPGCPLVKTQQ